MMMQKTKKNSNSSKGNRLLISINVLGSAGPLRFLVNEEEVVSGVIETALRNYAREGRLPILGSDLNNFLLYSANSGTDALSPSESIGSKGGRNFVLCKKTPVVVALNANVEVPTPTRIRKRVKMTNELVRITRKGSGSMKSWINNSLSFKISSH